MPPVSKKQKKFMDAAAHSPAFAKKAGVPMSVAKDFSASGKGKKFAVGGPVARPSASPAPRITQSGPPVQMGASAKPTAPLPVRKTTTAPQALAKSFGPKYFKKGGSSSVRSSKGKSK